MQDIVQREEEPETNLIPITLTGVPESPFSLTWFSLEIYVYLWTIDDDDVLSESILNGKRSK